jgi:hypothetical protein
MRKYPRPAPRSLAKRRVTNPPSTSSTDNSKRLHWYQCWPIFANGPKRNWNRHLQEMPKNFLSGSVLSVLTVLAGSQSICLDSARPMHLRGCEILT